MQYFVVLRLYRSYHLTISFCLPSFQFINFVCADLSIGEPVTNASNIVTGTDPELTNTLLQQLAISLYKHQNGAAAVVTAVAPESSGRETPVAVTKMVPTWVTSVQVWLSLDNATWSHNQVYSTQLRDEKGWVNIKLLPTG